MPALAVLAAALSGSAASTGYTGRTSDLDADNRFVSGRVVDQDGQPIAGADIVVGESGRERTDANGRFARRSDGATWVSVDAVGFVSRTRAAAPGSPFLVRLTRDVGDTVSLHFAGDVMAGRRFYDRNEDGDTADAQLAIPAELEEHEALLADIAPLLADADLSIVNLESPLTLDPWFASTSPRPATFHPTKEFAFSSHPLTAAALRTAGVDVVDLGNNHLFDRLDEGLADTLNALDEAGIAHFGAGRNDVEAWQPTVINVQGQRLAFIGCTTILGDSHPITYVATADKGGAAACDGDRLAREVAAATRQADAVIVMIHGGFEYDPVPSTNVAALTATARAAGARLVVNHHPHVVGGLDWDGSSLAALNMGNFLFDQTIWQTFPSYLLNVDLRRGKVVRAYTEPIVVDDYRPRGVVGSAAARIGRIASGLNPGPYVMEDGAVEVDLHHQGTKVLTATMLNETPGTVVRVCDGHELSGVEGHTLGRDILGVGDFEDDDIDDEQHEADFWELQPGREFGPSLGINESSGARISRRRGDATDAYLNPVHRILIPPQTEFTAIGRVAAPPGARVFIQLSWYSGTVGPSTSQFVQEVDIAADGQWGVFRLDAVAPSDAVAVGIFLGLAPPLDTDVATAAFDDVALIQWELPDTSPDSSYGYLRLLRHGTVTTQVTYLPGGAEWAASTGPALEPIVTLGSSANARSDRPTHFGSC